MFILCSPNFAVMCALRCGNTNMYHYFGIEQYSGTGFTMQDWKQHHDPIVVLRNPLDRVVSSLYLHRFHAPTIVYQHSAPYMHDLLSCNFRIIDFYQLEQYIPRRGDLLQSWRSEVRLKKTATAEDAYVPNTVYTLQDLQQEVEDYENLMLTRDRISVEDWKKITDF